MVNSKTGEARPQIHLLASESDLVAGLALQVEHRQPAVAAMLLDEIERAQLHDVETLPEDAVRLGSDVDFVDEKTSQLRKVRLVVPALANIAEGRISILTPMGAALYGVRTGDSIDWPDLDGRSRRIRIVRVAQDSTDEAALAVN
jgi:regulator of nucleoside diphosphate kinase